MLNHQLGGKVIGLLLGLATSIALVLAVATPSIAAAADTTAVTQTAGVDNTRMGPYRALTQLSYQAFQKGDMATAAELSRILEKTWDQGHYRNQTDGPGGSLCKTNHDACEAIDKAMDAYIKPILHCATKAPDPTAVQAAYNDFLTKLKQAD